ncbi:ABC transporter ATP-binding protein [Aureimonas fodinaquatilis]|uniref:ABC transporter ATP-binding protein n=1 Tax=Aureimonas fodinaquatilis TaxID=2565783 RepID=A0A5B0DSB3_9HYPH|nr:ABC transporter ATP-binding protein [Aureimonas fodinaquatilis]KAA0969687.1 ABC transporter ATP-binding protein [Aureimonas fodinaquatilis]
MITLDNVSKRFSGNTAVDQVSFSVPQGAFLVLLGPSGCGKSTMLRMLAGLDHPTSGQIRFGDKLIADGSGDMFVPPAERGAGLVFQSYALWPHMTVAGNIDWPLKVAGCSAQERRAAINTSMDMLGIAQLANRYPGEISGGQQQRVALARMIAPKPGIMLFDEPLSNLDATLRVEMRFELTKLHRATGATSVYVTHDQVEAMTMASHVAVLNHGRIEQFDTPNNLLANPASAFVAGFVGTPPANLINVEDGKWFGTLEDPALKGHSGTAMVRAEEFSIHAGPGHRRIACTLAEVVPMAGQRLVQSMTESGQRLTAIAEGNGLLSERLYFELPASPSALFDQKGARV